MYMPYGILYSTVSQIFLNFIFRLPQKITES